MVLIWPYWMMSERWRHQQFLLSPCLAYWLFLPKRHTCLSRLILDHIRVYLTQPAVPRAAELGTGCPLNRRFSMLMEELPELTGSLRLILYCILKPSSLVH